MSDIIIPNSRTPVQIGEKQRVCVLTHIDTGRILCFCLDDAFASTFVDAGYIKHELHHANEYDMWAKRLREQTKRENEAEDYAYLEKENRTRQKLRQQLKDRLDHVNEGASREAVASALHCLDVMESRRKRYREESFMANEGYSADANVGEALVNKIMKPTQ
jgi:hypothetical protein